jgi:putative ABC transport system permease protein
VAVFPLENISADKLREEIENMEGVKKAIFFDSYTALIEGEEFAADITRDFAELEGQMLYEGNYPKTPAEAAIGGAGAAALGISIGDTITIARGDKEAAYEISGFIHSGNYVGKQLSLTEEGASRLKPDFTPSTMYVYLEEGQAADVFIEALKSRYGSAITEPINMDELIEGQTSTYVAMTALLAVFVLLITGVIVFLILYFVIKTMISRRRRRFGVQKALGYTTYQIMQQIALSFLPVAFFGALIGVICGSFGVNPLISALFRSFGIMRFDMVISYSWLAALCMGMVLLSYAIAMAISYRIRAISAYILVTE